MDSALKQYSLADRAFNPSVQDICRLFQQWRKTSYGSDDGKPLFQRLQLEVDNYIVSRVGRQFNGFKRSIPLMKGR
jgi:hypothetical protein